MTVLKDKPCIKCGAQDRKTNGQCRPCAKKYYTKWSKENREKIKALSASRYKKDPEKYRTSKNTWTKKNPEKTKAIKATKC